MLKAVFFDLDGTLLPMDEQEFAEGYFRFLCAKMMPSGYEPRKLIDTIWKGTAAMMANDGSKTNEQAFWDCFAGVYGKEALKDAGAFEDFYAHDFAKTKAFCKENPLARGIVDFCHSHVEKTVLSTNPIFPSTAQTVRLSFIHLSPEDFAFVTDYQNSCFAKPNPAYFDWLLKKFSLKPEEVILFGNNTYEDGDCATRVGIDTYLVKGFIIHSKKARGLYPEIGMTDIIPTIEKEIAKRKMA